MASGVNVKMGVSGIAQFKQNMATAKNSLKTVDEQLKLNEKQFKATGDAEAFMQQKSELLKVKLEEQKAIVEQAEKALEKMTSQGVDKSSKAFQDMQQQLLRARSGLLDTQMEMQGIETSADDAAAAVTDMATDMSNIGKQISFQTVTEGLDRITDGLKAAALRAINFGKELVNATLGAGHWADELVTTATQYKQIDPSMTPEKLQRMRKTANLIDTSVESIMSSKQKLAKASEKGNDDMDAIFAQLGVERTRYGEVRDVNELFWETGEALMKIQNTSDRIDMGRKLFGDWDSLAPLFEAGREEYEKTMEAQSVVTQENIDKLTKMDDAYVKLENELETLKNTFFSELAPSITTVTDSLSGLVSKFNEFLQTDEGKEMMNSLGQNIEKLFSSLTEFDAEGAIQKVGEVMGGIKDAFDWITKNWGTVSTGLLAIAAGWGAIKVATVGLKIAQVLTGAGSLLGGGTPKPTMPSVTPVSAGDPVAKGAKGAATGGAAAGASALGVAATKVASNTAASFVSSGLSELAPVVGDMFLNQTNMGRAIRDAQGIEAVWEGLKQDVSEKADEIKVNAAGFGENWDPHGENANVLAQLYGRISDKVAEILNPPAEQRRGTNENFAAAMESQTDELQDAFVKFVTAEREMMEFAGSPEYTDETMQALVDAANEAQEALLALEGHEDILQAYSDWRQRNSYGNDDWILPDEKFLTENAKTTGENTAVSLENGLASKAGELEKEAEVVGENTAVGLANGIEKGSVEAIMAMDRLTNLLIGSATRKLAIKSPSRVMMGIGEYVSIGFAEGIENGYGRISDAVDGMARVATGVAGGNGTGGTAATRIIDVTLMIGPEKLTEVLVPLVDGAMGEEVDLMRR